MPLWLAPVLKALPHLASIATAGAHVFTKRKASPAETQSELIQQQVSELQTAASQTDDHVRELAAELKDALVAIEQGALSAETRLNRLRYICYGSVCVAVLALIVSTVVFVAH